MARPGEARPGPAWLRRYRHGPRPAASGFQLPATSLVRGISISGAEFTPLASGDPAATSMAFSNLALGTYNSDYRYEGVTSPGTSNTKTFAFLKSRGWKYIKIPVMWERLGDQFYNGGTGVLNATEVARLTTELDNAHAEGLRVCIDVHNFGVYFVDGSITGQSAIGTGWRHPIGSAFVPESSFSAFWGAMTTQFRAHPAVYGFHIMNEPQPNGGFTQAAWYSASQAAYTAIRAVDTTGALVVRIGGWFWSDLFNWQANNQATPWITGAASDPNCWFEAHHYWSEGNDGNYTTYAAALAYAVSLGFTSSASGDAMYARVRHDLLGLTGWLDNNGLARSQAVIGEVSWPNQNVTLFSTPADTVLWNRLGEYYLGQVTALGLHVEAWACGEFYSYPGGDPLPVYYASGGTSGGLDTTQPDSYAWEGSLVAITSVDVAGAAESAGVADTTIPTVHVGDSVSFP